jgi:hypothetical protein
MVRRYLAGAAVLALVLGILVPVGVRASEQLAQGFTFGASGDFGAVSRTGATLDLAGAQTDLFLGVGDLSYNQVTPESKWCDFVKSHVGSELPFELVSGDEEDNGPNGAIDSFAACLPDRIGGIHGDYGKQYWFDYPQSGSPLARFIMISPALTLDGSTWSYANGTSRQQWLVDAIRSAHAAGIPWVVVGDHEPCLSATAKSCTIGNDLDNVFVREGVDLVLQGHSHTYERSKQIALSSGCTKVTHGGYKTACVADDGADNAYTKGKGTIFVINGTSGKSLSTVDPSDGDAPWFARLMGSNLSPRYGYTRYEVTPTQIHAAYVGSTSGSFTDDFTISKLPADTTSPVAAVTSPVAGATVSGTVPVSATASDDTGVSRVEIWRDGATLVGSDAAAPYDVAWDTASVPNGSHTLTARAFDAAGNVGESAPVAVTVDNPPQVTYAILPVADSTINRTTNAPDTASGTLAVDTSPDVTDVLMRFDTSAIPGAYTSVKLVLSCVNSSNKGGVFSQAAAGAWDETTVTWSTAPALGPAIPGAVLGAVTNGLQYQVDLRSYMTGPGVYNLRVTTSSTDAAGYASKDSASPSLRPILVVTTAG